MFKEEIQTINFNDIKDKIENVKIIATYNDKKQEKYIFITYDNLKWLMENKPLRNESGIGYKFPNDDLIRDTNCEECKTKEHCNKHCNCSDK